MVNKLLEQPIEFLGATVISVTTNIGFGSTESTMSLELIEDCNKGQVFLPKVNDNYAVGRPVSVEFGDFFFGGFLSSWKENLGAGGYTISCTITDPRSILENVTVVTDSYMGSPVVSSNYVNVYNYHEGSILGQINGATDCTGFGSSQTYDRGMPYLKIMEALENIDPTALTSTGFPYKINWSTVIGAPSFSIIPPTYNGYALDIPVYQFNNSYIPTYFRIDGPATSILQLLQTICDVLGLEFYCFLTDNYLINIGYIDLKVAPTSFSWIKNVFGGYATEISYGQEIRNEKTKNVVIGEKKHYMSITDEFDHFFGEDTFLDGTGQAALYPVVPFARNECGFWINKKIDSLNIQLDYPFPSVGPFWISEMDIRTAMAGFNLWRDRALSTGILYNDNPRTFNYQLQHLYPNGWGLQKNYVDTVGNFFMAGNAASNAASDNIGKLVVDASHAMSQRGLELSRNIFMNDLESIHSWIQNLGSTYYGKEYITNLDEQICFNYSVVGNVYSEKIYTDSPTGAGAWVDPGVSVLGLVDPDLEVFRQDDRRIGCFIRFDIEEPPLDVLQPDPGLAAQGLGRPGNVAVANLSENQNPIDGGNYGRV